LAWLGLHTNCFSSPLWVLSPKAEEAFNIITGQKNNNGGKLMSSLKDSRQRVDQSPIVMSAFQASVYFFAAAFLRQAFKNKQIPEDPAAFKENYFNRFK
jgi:hypothetical protein